MSGRGVKQMWEDGRYATLRAASPLVNAAAMTDPEQVARGILDALQEAFVRRDVAEISRLLDDEIVLFGTAAENLDRTQTDAYVARVLDQKDTVRWEWDQVLPVLEQTGVLAFAVVGTVGFDDDQGVQVGQRDAFRLTCVAVLREGRWRLRHFHGSMPQER